MIELDTPEGRQQLREYYESIGLEVAIGEVYFISPSRPADLEPEQREAHGSRPRC